jgi:hypothetical protein
MKNSKFKNGILIFLMVLLFYPLIQTYFPHIKEKQLQGSFTLAEKPDSLIENWFAGEYQIEYEKYYNDSLGFRSFFVRVNNQINFSIFNKPSTQNTIIGKDEILYQDFYIDSYLGNDYMGESKIDSEVKKIEFVQNELLKRGKKILYVIAPGKAAIYPKNFPTKYDAIPKKTSNYDMYVKYLKKYKIEYLDFRDYFLQIKDTCKYPLFPKNGTHWSGYGVALVADSLYKKLAIMINKNLSRLKISDGYEESINLKYTDNDIGKALNLYFDPSNWKMYYPEIEFETEGKSKINALIIGDSFSQSFYGFGNYFENIFTPESKYFYYNNLIYWPYIEENMRSIDNYKLSDMLNQSELIMIISTDQNLKKNSFGFIDNLYSLLKNDFSIDDDVEIEKIINKIKSDEQWLGNIKKQAKERKISVDEMLQKNAVYWMKRHKK